MENRKCRLCGQVKPIVKFANAGTTNGKKYYRRLCIPCYTKSKKPRIVKIRNWFADYKKTLQCEHCGNNDHRVFDFHHRDKSKKEGTVSEMATCGRNSIETIKKEIDKCNVLCSNCHRILHYEELKEEKQLNG